MARRDVRPLLLIVTAAASLALTLTAWWSVRNEARQEARLRFDARAAEIVRELQGRMLDYEQSLRAAAGLFAASDRVEREEWEAFLRMTRIDQAYPGILAVGYAEKAADADRVPVLYVMPVDERNRRSLGYDMFSEPVRRRALEVARDSGEPALSGPVVLIQDAGTQRERGFLLYLPVYRNGAPLSGTPERRAALQGFVYSAFRARDLVAGVVGRSPGLGVRLSDVTDGSDAEALFDSGQDAPERPRGASFSRSDEFGVRQRIWRVETTSGAAFEAEIASNRPEGVLAGGLAVSVLLVVIVWTLLNTREQARVLARNITAALRSSEERLQLALTSSNTALFDWNVESGLLHLSSAWSAMLGGAAQETDIPGHKLMQLVHPDDAPAVEKQVRDLLAGRIDAYRVQHRVRRGDGSWIWIESVARANERDPAGRALRVTGANTDISERKRLEQAKAEFIATASHELRTPLTSLIVSLNLLREGTGGALPADAASLVDIASENSDRLAALVNDLLDMDRLESGSMDFDIGEVDAHALVGQAVSLNTAYAERLGVRLAGEANPGLRVLADHDRLIQVLTNLLSNAAKFSPQGATVLVRAKAVPGGVRFEVEDRGRGIPEEFRGRIFGKFAQADSSDSRLKGGTGLGLAISKALVERMQGRIGFDSEPGRGTTFWLELPAASGAPPA